MCIESRVPALKDKLENALNESRILMLGVQVLIGFDYRAVFEDRFANLPLALQELRLASLGLMLLSLTLLISPVPYHWIFGRGRNPQELHGYGQKIIEIALAPFVVALSMDLFIASSKIVRPTMALAIPLAVLALAVFFWYGLGYLKKEHIMHDRSSDHPLELKDRIKEVLIETRITLPGVQATLGFQFIIVLASGFDALPQSLKMVHLASLLCSALCAVLLIAPAAYHRIALDGEDSEQLLNFASAMVLWALVPLSLALSGDVAVVVWKVTQQMDLAVGSAGATLFTMLGFWFGYMAWRRRAT
jgi:hypothetical protein